MKLLKNKVVTVIILVGMLVVIFGINQALLLRKAHSTFENYYAFRGCTQLLLKGQDFGVCKTNTNQTIKIVKFQDKWYLDGDLPCGFLCF